MNPPFGGWLFRENLTNSGLVEVIFNQFIGFLDDKNLILNEGKMVDASFTVAPRQRNTKDENDKIKKGEGNELWNDKPNKKKHKDIDARWTKKNHETFFGYKNHAKLTQKVKLSIHSSLQMHRFMTHKHWNLY